MAQFIFEIPDTEILHFIDMMAIRFDYEWYLSNLEENEVPLNKQEYVHRELAKWAQREALEVERKIKHAELLKQIEVKSVSIT